MQLKQGKYMGLHLSPGTTLSLLSCSSPIPLTELARGPWYSAIPHRCGKNLPKLAKPSAMKDSSSVFGVIFGDIKMSSHKHMPEVKV